MTDWVVWSEQHGAWWRPGLHGYTRSLRQAGRYPEDRARAIAADGNRYESELHEVALPDPLEGLQLPPEERPPEFDFSIRLRKGPVE